MSEFTKRTSFEQLYGDIFGLIRDGQYRPGDRIGVKELSLLLRVSPTPVREVLSRLVGREIVEERRSEGYYLARLDARDVADLYRLHLACIEKALPAVTPKKARPDLADAAVWDVFAALVAETGDHILADVQRYLAERLIVLRRSEAQLFARAPEDAGLQAALRAGAAAAELRPLIRACHRLRWRAAPELSLLLGRR